MLRGVRGGWGGEWIGESDVSLYTPPGLVEIVSLFLTSASCFGSPVISLRIDVGETPHFSGLWFPVDSKNCL